MATKENILSGRQAVDAYRLAHGELHSQNWRKEVPGKHTDLLNKMLYALQKHSFSSLAKDYDSKKTEILAKFWEQSDLLNVQELGFESGEDFEVKATKVDREALDGMWH